MSLVTILHYILNYIALQPYFFFEYGLTACIRRTTALLPTVLRCVTKILYGLCIYFFLYMTKPSLLAFPGSIAPCPGIRAVAFLCCEHNPTVSKPLRYSRRW